MSEMNRAAMTTRIAMTGVLTCCVSVSLADGLYFMGLGDLPGGPVESRSWDVSSDGTTVVGESATGYGGGLQGFRWRADEGMVAIGVQRDKPMAERINCIPFGVSSDGSVVAGLCGGWEACRWTASEGMVRLGDLPGGGTYSRAYDVSSDGVVVVGSSKSSNSGEGYEAFRWTADEGMVGLGDLPGGDFYSTAYGVSGDGSVVVGNSQSSASVEKVEAYRWTAATGMVPLGDLPGGLYYSNALGVSEDGRVVVGWSRSTLSHFEAFRWTADEGMVGLGDLPGGIDWSEGHAVSEDGSVIVGFGRDAVGFTAMIWDSEHGMRSLQEVLTSDFGLDLTGWRLSSAHGITPDGLTIAGTGKNPNGNSEAWIAHIPEPATVCLVGLGAFVLWRGPRRVGRVC